MGSEIDNSSWVAYVKYKTGGKTEIIPISKIKVKVLNSKKKQVFNPQSLTDFETRTWYSVKTAQDSRDGSEHTWYALIGKITETGEEMGKYLAENKRLHWPTMNENDSEALSTDMEVDPPSVSSLSAARSSQLSKRKMVKAAKDESYEELLRAHPLFDEDISRKRPRETESQPTCETEDRDTSVLNENKRLSAIVEDLISQLKKKDDELLKHQNIETNINNMLTSFHEAVEKSEKNIQVKLDEKLDALNKNYDAKFTHLEEKFNQLSEQSLRASSGFHESVSSGGFPKENTKVHLGGQMYCTKFCHETLTNPLASHPDWFHALLIGCFGDNAPLMRWRQSAGTIKLTPEEKTTICRLYKEWLQSLKKKHPANQNGPQIRQYSDEEVERLMRELPAYLGDRAYSLSKQGDAAIKTGPKKQPNNAEKTKDGVKRKYVKKGDFAARAKQGTLPPPSPPRQEQPTPPLRPPPPQEQQIHPLRPPPPQERQHLELQTSRQQQQPDSQPDLTELQVSSHWRNAERSHASGVSTNMPSDMGGMLTRYFENV